MLFSSAHTTNSQKNIKCTATIKIFKKKNPLCKCQKQQNALEISEEKLDGFLNTRNFEQGKWAENVTL